ncbi:MAG: Holliday junction resolvase RuvX [Acidobacteria bacterium]|nr:Holliday junction resolvase RuvX [Acidobacteriota bacterium]
MPTKDQIARNEKPRPAQRGRLLALDLGARRVGVAVSDEMRVSVRALPVLPRGSWKNLVASVARLVSDFDAAAVVLGLPLRLDGTEGDAARETRRLARNLELSLEVPVHLQDERLTSRAAEETLRDEGAARAEINARVDGESAALTLRDFIASRERG